MNNTDQPLVSILTPVYNGEAYLRECIESVLRQTYRNWEYIIVNNRSEDATLAIAEEYALRDPRIRIHTNSEFVSSLANHNIAFRQMSPASQFCKIVHADDWLFPECLEKMVEVATANLSVGVVSAYALWGTEIKLDGLPYERKVVSGREICRTAILKGGPYVTGSSTSTMIRSDFIRRINPFYNEQNIHTDTEACYAVLAQSDLGFVHQVLTFTRIHEQSVTSKNSLLDTTLPGDLETLLKYGPVFLTPTEFARKKREYLNAYYGSLARRMLRRREYRYWQFHKERLKELGISLNIFRVAAIMPIEVAKLCFSPTRLRRLIKPIFAAPGLDSAHPAKPERAGKVERAGLYSRKSV
jgi:glycosyltransferase involved in cell wall biosynthesis